MREPAIPGCHRSAKGCSDRYHVLNAETGTAGPTPAIEFSPAPVSELGIDGSSSLADQVWAAGKDTDVDDFEMPTMCQMSARFDFGTLSRDDVQAGQLVADVSIQF